MGFHQERLSSLEALKMMARLCRGWRSKQHFRGGRARADIIKALAGISIVRKRASPKVCSACVERVRSAWFGLFACVDLGNP